VSLYIHVSVQSYDDEAGMDDSDSDIENNITVDDDMLTHHQSTDDNYSPPARACVRSFAAPHLLDGCRCLRSHACQ
jgi:hypothetical protein